MTERIILSIVSLAMLSFSLRQPGRFSKIIIAGLTIGILLTWISDETVILIGFSIYTLCCLLTVFYGAIKTHLYPPMRIIICLTGILVFTHNISALMVLPYATVVQLLMTVPIVGYLIILARSHFKFTPETGFMTILAVDGLIYFSKMLV